MLHVYMLSSEKPGRNQKFQRLQMFTRIFSSKLYANKHKHNNLITLIPNRKVFGIADKLGQNKVPSVALVIGVTALCVQLFLLYPWHHELNHKFELLKTEMNRIEKLSDISTKKIEEVIKIEFEKRNKSEINRIGHEILDKSYSEMLKFEIVADITTKKIEDMIEEKERNILDISNKNHT